MDSDAEKCNSQRSSSTQQKLVSKQKDDPFLVDFGGTDDWENPVNWSKKKKWSIIGLISTLCLIVYVFPNDGSNFEG